MTLTLSNVLYFGALICLALAAIGAGQYDIGTAHISWGWLGLALYVGHGLARNKAK